MLHEVDDFIGDLVSAVDRRGEDTIIVFFGDHLPTLGLTDEDMKSGSIFKTKYITWNNMGLAKEDADLTAYQLLAQTMDQVGIHEGTMFRYHQTQADSETYLSGLDNLQYDLLYGKRYAYHDEDRYPATDLVMDVEDVTITSVRKNTYNNTLTVYGDNFTKNTKIFVNGSKVSTNYLTPSFISTSLDNVKDGDTITVNILGSKSIVLREGVGEVVYIDPDVVHETETTVTETQSSETETTETETQSSETESIVLREGVGEVVYIDPDVVHETETTVTETQSSETETTETETQSSETENSETETQSSETENSETKTQSSKTSAPVITKWK